MDVWIFKLLVVKFFMLRYNKFIKKILIFTVIVHYTVSE